MIKNLFRKSKPVSYFCSYFGEVENGFGYGNIQINYPRRIRNIKDIDLIGREIAKEKKLENAVVLDYKEMGAV
jgi:hypothetical protein